MKMNIYVIVIAKYIVYSIISFKDIVVFTKKYLNTGMKFILKEWYHLRFCYVTGDNNY